MEHKWQKNFNSVLSPKNRFKMLYIWNLNAVLQILISIAKINCYLVDYSSMVNSNLTGQKMVYRIKEINFNDNKSCTEVFEFSYNINERLSNIYLNQEDLNYSKYKQILAVKNSKSLFLLSFKHQNQIYPNEQLIKVNFRKQNFGFINSEITNFFLF
jgi:hypothetical protein